MAKLTLTDLASLANEASAIATINANHSSTETALENTLSRDGTSPNTMSASLDMNSSRILNLPTPVNGAEPATKTYVDALIIPDFSSVESAIAAQHGTYWVLEHGLVADGSTDNSAALTLLMATIKAAGGGEIRFGPGTYRFNSPIILPNNNAVSGAPKQVPFTFRGSGAYWSGQSPSSLTADTGSTKLDIRTTNAAGRFHSLGLGLLTINGITFIDDSASPSATPFIHITNTSCHIHGNAFIGTRTELLCDQDAIVLGGLTTTIDGATTAPFQGYGTVIERNFFNRIRRAVYLRTYCNAIAINNNWIERQSGSNLANGACIELDGGLDSNTNNMIVGNMIEVSYYVYGIKLSDTCLFNHIIGNGCFDPTGTTVAGVRINDSSCSDNFVTGGISNASNYLSDAGTRTTYFSNRQSIYSKLGPVEFLQTAGFPLLVGDITYTMNSAFLIKPTLTTVVGATVAEIQRSAVDGGASMMKILQSGDINWGDQGASGARLTTEGRSWGCAGTGGAMTIDTGSGGSNLTIDCLETEVRSQGNTRMLRLGQSGPSAEAGINFGSSGDTNLYRSAADVLKTDDVFRTLVTVVGSLPAASATYTGGRAFVTDANATTFASVVAGGGANGVPVYCDGTNWRIG